MPDVFEELAGLDKLVHEPARLAILTILSQVASADFLYLQRLTGMTKGNLSGHLTTLAEGGLIQIEKRFVGKVSNTLVQLTPEGRAAVERYWQQMQRLRQEARKWKPGKEERDTK